MKCHFCKRKAIGGPCRWPVRAFVPTVYGELKEGDLVRRWATGTDDRPPAVIYKLERFRAYAAEAEPSLVGIVLEKQAGKRKLYKSITVQATSKVRVEIPTYCNADMCEHHQQERSPRNLICVDHWRAWEAIA